MRSLFLGWLCSILTLRPLVTLLTRRWVLLALLTLHLLNLFAIGPKSSKPLTLDTRSRPRALYRVAGLKHGVLALEAATMWGFSFSTLAENDAAPPLGHPQRGLSIVSDAEPSLQPAPQPAFIFGAPQPRQNPSGFEMRMQQEQPHFEPQHLLQPHGHIEPEPQRLWEVLQSRGP